jgi:hypothetical protein
MTSGARYSGVPQSVYVSPVPTFISVRFTTESTQQPQSMGGDLDNEQKLTISNSLRKSKIDQFHMPFGIQQYVLRLQISISNSLLFM